MGEMFRRSVLVCMAATTCLAQSDTSGGFVNRGLLGGVHLWTLPAKNSPPAVKIPKQQCLRVPPQERIPAPEVDRKMVIPFPERTGDEKMVIRPLPVCPVR